MVNGVTLTINPGAIVKFQDNRRLFIDGKLMAAGTPSQPIYFTSYRDDSIGGDTNGNGSSVGERGDWGWIEFRFASDDTSTIDNATVRYGGRVGFDYLGNITLYDASPTIRNATISHSNGDGIWSQTSFPPLTCNNIVDNRLLGLRNNTPTSAVNATNLYWGSPSGPHHATLNPAGQGNGVSNGVNFSPWRTTPCFATPDLPFRLYLPAVQRN